MAADDGDDGLGRIALARVGLGEGLGAHDVERGDAHEALGVEDALVLERLGGDGDGAVDGVRDDEDEGFGAVLGAAMCVMLAGVGVGTQFLV